MRIFKENVPIDDRWHARQGKVLHVGSQDFGSVSFWRREDSTSLREYLVVTTMKELSSR